MKIKPTISSGHWGSDDGTVESADKIVDGLTQPTSNLSLDAQLIDYYLNQMLMAIDGLLLICFKTKTIRSLYIAVPEADSDNIEFLEISKGN